MKTLTLIHDTIDLKAENSLPRTSRGRAIYTVDWFLNGTPLSHNYDNPERVVKNSYSH